MSLSHANQRFILANHALSTGRGRIKGRLDSARLHLYTSPMPTRDTELYPDNLLELGEIVTKRLITIPSREAIMIKAIDFFCGAGGLTRGLLDAKIRVLAGVDNDSRLRDTYEKNNQPSRFIAEDINKIDILELRRDIGISSSDVVLYAACTPCQPFSTLSKMRGDHEKRGLLLSFAKLVEAAPPDYILVENVPGLSGEHGREIHDPFMATLKRCGFKWFFQDKLDAADYGVPQFRKRFILLASRRGPLEIPLRSETRISLETAITRFPAINDGDKSDSFLNHESRKLAPHHKRIVEAVPLDGGSRRDVEDESILLRCHVGKPNAASSVFGRMAWKRPAPTLTVRCTDVYCGRFTHPEQNRGISLREAAAIQTFSDDYEFFGTYQHIQKQIGNAVPVELARRLGDAFMRSLNTQRILQPNV
jgi:DNA (cytosine-5)-methyltransferase 1